jgi:uncharacterized protein (DUF305 family)
MSTRINRIAGIAAIAATTAVVLAGCTFNFGVGDGDGDGDGMMGGNGNGPGNGMMGGSGSGAFSGIDVMFAQMMIPHHQQAVDMSDLALEKSSDPDVLALAKQIRDAQAPEIEQMQGWLDGAGSGSMMGHDPDDMGMGMGGGGMLSESEMDALRAATGTEFDRLYLEGMIDHHEGALRMTQMIVNSDNPEVKALADAIITSQTAEIEYMKQLLAR